MGDLWDRACYKELAFSQFLTAFSIEEGMVLYIVGYIHVLLI